MKTVIILFFAFITVNGYTQQNYLWAGKAGGTQTDIGKAISIDPSGNFVTTGTFGGTSDFDPGPGVSNRISAGAEDIFIAKYDAQGNLMWVVSFGGTGAEDCKSVRTDAAGNIIIGGAFRNTVDFDPGAGTASHTSVGATDMFIATFNANGIFQWVKVMGGSMDNYINSLDLDAAGNIYVTGQFIGTVDFDPNANYIPMTSSGGTNPDIFLAKYSSLGAIYWSIPLGNGGYDGGNSVRCTPGGEIYLTGYFTTVVEFNPLGTSLQLTANGTFADAFLAKYSTTGILIWVNQVGGTQDQFGRCIDLDAQLRPVLCGSFRTIVDFDPGPAAVNRTAVANTDGFIVKYDSAGIFMHVVQIGGSGNEDVLGVAVDQSNGREHSTGTFAGTCDFDPGAATVSISSSSGTIDAFKASYDNTGNYIQAFPLGAALSDDGRAVAVNSLGDVFLTGEFGALNVDFDPSGATAALSSSGGMDIFLAKYGVCTLPTLTAVTAGSNAICAGSSTTIALTGSLNSAVNWNWYTGGCGSTLVGTGTSITVSPSATTTYFVRGEGGCVGTAASCGGRTINVNSLPVVSISGNTNLCPDESTTLTASGASTFFWSTGDTTNSIVAGTSNTGNIYVAGVDTNGCTSGDTILLTATLIDTSVTLNIGTLTAAQNGALYQWVDCSNGYSFIAGATSQSFTPIVNGMYACIINVGNCFDTSVCYAMLSTYTSGNDSPQTISLSPNPSSDFITLNNLPGQTIITMMSSDGRKIRELKLNSSREEIDVRDLPQGLYIILAQSNTGITSLKFTKE